jgi:hypothetical protein
MTVCFSTRAPNADYLGFEASPEAIIAAAKKAVIGVDNMMWGSDEARRQSHRQAAFTQIEFATDSPLEEDGFEPSVPRVESICLDTVLPPGAVEKACSDKHCTLGGPAVRIRLPPAGSL